MKSKRLILTMSVLAAGGIALASCGGTNLGEDSTSKSSSSSTTSISGSGSNSGSSSSTSGSDTTLWVVAYDGGYGQKWLNDISALFTAKTGIQVHVDFSNSIADRIESDLKGVPDYDLYISHGLNWQTYASSGWLANLDDLYTSSVDGFEGTFEDRLANGAADLSKVKGKDDTEEHFYKACFTQGCGGFVYNMDMFEANGWTIPETYDDLVTLCNTIVSAQVAVEGSRSKVVPFAWSGKDRQYYWDYPVFEWWQELAGQEKIDTILQYKGSDGTYANGYEMYDPETYGKEFYQAYGMWWDLIANNSANSMKSSSSLTLPTAQAAFVNGEAAMIPYAQWAKYELSQISENETIPFNVAMMKTPKANSTVARSNYMVGFGDSMIVPAKAREIEAAKKFINFLATENACKTFVEDSNGAFLAFDYSNVNLGDAEKDTYIHSIHEKLMDHNFHLVSTNPISYRTVNCVMPWVYNTYYYQTAMLEPAAYNATEVGKKVYNMAKESWKTWVATAGLKD